MTDSVPGAGATAGADPASLRVLVDLSMPRMSGEDVVRWVREHPEHGQGLKIVVVSAWAGDHRPTLHELGVTSVLPKPFRRQHLVDVISQTTSSA